MFQKGHKKMGGRQKGSGHHEWCRKYAEEKGLAFLADVANGKIKDVNIAGQLIPARLSVRVEAAEYLIDQGIGKAAPRYPALEGADVSPIILNVQPFDAGSAGKLH